MVSNQNHNSKISNHDFKSFDFKSYPTLDSAPLNRDYIPNLAHRPLFNDHVGKRKSESTIWYNFFSMFSTLIQSTCV